MAKVKLECGCTGQASSESRLSRLYCNEHEDMMGYTVLES